MHVVGPADDWCTVINEVIEPGDLVRLLAGDYYGPCEIIGRETEEVGELTMIQALDFSSRPRFLHPGDPDVPYVLRITGQSVAILDSTFEDVPEHAVAVEIEAEREIRVRFTDFLGVGDLAVRVVSGEDVRVQDSWFEQVGRAATFGCPEGSCPVPELQFSGNVLVGVAGAVVHPGAAGLVADNVAAGMVAPLVQYQGAGGVIEGNLGEGSGPILEVEGAEVLVRNNLLVGDLAVTGAGVELVGNSILGDVLGEADARQNAVSARALSGPGNVHCGQPADCWEDAQGWDFRPVADGPLHQSGAPDEALQRDFCGANRDATPDVGAVERTEGAQPLELQFKRLQACVGPGLPDDEEEEDTGGSPPDAEPSACGCQVRAGGPAALAWLVGLVAVLGRRRAASGRVR